MAPETLVGPVIPMSPRPSPAGGPVGRAPSSDEVRAYLTRTEKRFPRVARVETVGRSGEGRPIDTITLRDPRRPHDQQQTVLIVAGQHGNEESARLVCVSMVAFSIWSMTPR